MHEAKWGCGVVANKTRRKGTLSSIFENRTLGPVALLIAIVAGVLAFMVLTATFSPNTASADTTSVGSTSATAGAQASALPTDACVTGESGALTGGLDIGNQAATLCANGNGASDVSATLGNGDTT